MPPLRPIGPRSHALVVSSLQGCELELKLKTEFWFHPTRPFWFCRNPNKHNIFSSQHLLLSTVKKGCVFLWCASQNIGLDWKQSCPSLTRIKSFVAPSPPGWTTAFRFCLATLKSPSLHSKIQQRNFWEVLLVVGGFTPRILWINALVWPPVIYVGVWPWMFLPAAWGLAPFWLFLSWGWRLKVTELLEDPSKKQTTKKKTTSSLRTKCSIGQEILWKLDKPTFRDHRSKNEVHVDNLSLSMFHTPLVPTCWNIIISMSLFCTINWGFYTMTILWC